ncbi:MAG TPA: aspartyl protease family protein [Steroidobacteraceae bacterium]|nr:aspartyl protease family protein [Steroidobacteraceae bacterium]
MKGAISQSRRGVIAGLSAALACPSTQVWCADNERTEVVAPRHDATPEISDDNTLGAHTDPGQRMTVSLLVNGRGAYQFVVDTGADRSIIAEDIAQALNLTRGGAVLLNGLVRQVVSSTVAVQSLSTGSITRTNLSLPVLPRSLLQADGYLGLDVLADSRVAFDFERHTVELGMPHSPLRSLLGWFNDVRLRSGGELGHLRAAGCRVDDVQATAFVDTGAEVSAGNRALLGALNGRNGAYSELGMLRLTGVTGGAILGHVVSTSIIHIQDLKFTSGNLVIADLPVFDIWGLGKEPALLIGMNYLRQLARMSIDYRFKEIRFSLANSPNDRQSALVAKYPAVRESAAVRRDAS